MEWALFTLSLHIWTLSLIVFCNFVFIIMYPSYLPISQLGKTMQLFARNWSKENASFDFVLLQFSFFSSNVKKKIMYYLSIWHKIYICILNVWIFTRTCGAWTFLQLLIRNKIFNWISLCAKSSCEMFQCCLPIASSRIIVCCYSI